MAREGMNCLLLAGGEIKSDSGVLALAGEPGLIICADSGYDHCLRLGLTPHLLVGDFDSIHTPLPPNIPRVAFAAEKDYTDTTLAIEEALARGCSHMVLAGVLGGRLDHTLGNLQSLLMLSRRKVKAVLTDGLTTIQALTDGALALEPKDNHYFSLVPFGGDCKGVSIRGAVYGLDRYDLPAQEPRAVSNEFAGRPVEITVEEGTLLVVCVPKDETPFRLL